LDTNTKDAEFPLGVLTAENRDVWADVRSKLLQLGNEKALEAIDTALYCIALDDTNTLNEDSLSRNFLYGNPNNRWFDKNYSLIVNRDGYAGLNFEHS